MTVLEWFQKYRADLRAAHPLWVASFHMTEQEYFLDIRPVDSPKDVLEIGQNPKNIWADEIAIHA
jgi:hypothetical protein